QRGARAQFSPGAGGDDPERAGDSANKRNRSGVFGVQLSASGVGARRTQTDTATGAETIGGVSHIREEFWNEKRGPTRVMNSRRPTDLTSSVLRITDRLLRLSCNFLSKAAIWAFRGWAHW